MREEPMFTVITSPDNVRARREGSRVEWEWPDEKARLVVWRWRIRLPYRVGRWLG